MASKPYQRANEELLLHDYTLALSICPVPMLLASEKGEIALANEAFNTLFGFKVDELVGKNVSTLIPKRNRNPHQQLIADYFRNPGNRVMTMGRDVFGLTSTGEEIALEVHLQTATQEGCPHVIVVAHDIRDRKRHEQTMTLAMDAAASGMVMINESGNINYVNKAAVAMLGYDAEDLLDKPIEILVPQAQRAAHEYNRNGFLKNREIRPMAKALDVFAVHRDGHEIPVDVALTPVITPNGSMVVGTVLDLSERIAAQRAMARKSEELEIVNGELSQFAYSASHDLKSPLTSIVGLLAVCKEDLEDGDLDECRVNLDKISEIAIRSAKKVEGVLAIARSGYTQIARESVNFGDLLADVWLDVSGAPRDDLQFSVQLAHTDPIEIEVDTCKVILENLLSNAIRYRDADKPVTTIKVSTQSDESTFEFAVIDNGIGIRQKNQEVIFEMFKRLHENSGDGLGLALVKKQVDRLQGRIALNSTAGHGSEFVVTLPVGRVEGA